MPAHPSILDPSKRFQFSLPGLVKILKKPMPEPVLCEEDLSTEKLIRKDETISISKLKKVMEAKHYPAHEINFVTIAYHFIEDKVCGGKRRDDGDVAIVHPLAVATRAARMGMDISAICAALLHDAIEDTNRYKSDGGSVLPDQIVRLFGTSPPGLKCGQRTAELVVLLTKPKLLESEKRWVFAKEDSYFNRDDDYYRKTSVLPGENAELSLYDDRSEAYYSYLLNSGDIDAIVLKLLDNVHNAETMLGLYKAKAMKNLRTMARNTMRHAAIFLVQKDVEYITALFKNMGISIERSITPITPTKTVVPFKLRDRFDVAALLKHPNPQYAYITIYGSNPLVAFSMNYVEVGFPPRIGLNYAPLLTDYLRDYGFHVSPEKSDVPITSPVHESIVKVLGFTDNDERSKFIQPSEESPRFFDLMDGNGNVIASASVASLAQREVRFGPQAANLIAEAEARYTLLEKRLYCFYQEVIFPVLEKNEVNNPKK